MKPLFTLRSILAGLIHPDAYQSGLAAGAGLVSREEHERALELADKQAARIADLETKLVEARMVTDLDRDAIQAAISAARDVPAAKPAPAPEWDREAWAREVVTVTGCAPYAPLLYQIDIAGQFVTRQSSACQSDLTADDLRKALLASLPPGNPAPVAGEWPSEADVEKVCAFLAGRLGWKTFAVSPSCQSQARDLIASIHPPPDDTEVKALRARVAALTPIVAVEGKPETWPEPNRTVIAWGKRVFLGSWQGAHIDQGNAWLYEDVVFPREEAKEAGRG